MNHRTTLFSLLSLAGFLSVGSVPTAQAAPEFSLGWYPRPALKVLFNLRMEVSPYFEITEPGFEGTYVIGKVTNTGPGASPATLADLGASVVTKTWGSVTIHYDYEQFPIPSLAPGESHTFTYRLWGSLCGAARGHGEVMDFIVNLRVDPFGLLDESSEWDNEATMPMWSVQGGWAVSSKRC